MKDTKVQTNEKTSKKKYRIKKNNNDIIQIGKVTGHIPLSIFFEGMGNAYKDN